MKEQIKYFIEDIQYLGLANIFVILGMGIIEVLFVFTIIGLMLK